MKKTACFSSLVFILLVLLAGTAAADRLPNQTPENQVFSAASSVEAVGSYSGTQALQWTTGYDPATRGSGGLHTGLLDLHEVRSTTAYSEMTETNGGYVSETKTFDPDTRNKATGLFNVESTKTFTYATDANTGSIAQAAESVTVDNMGEITSTDDVIACPFGPSESVWFPAFCNVVYAKSMSQGVTSAAQSSSAQTRTVAVSADTPAELNYNFDVKPDASAGVGYAMGTFGTEFGISVKEERGWSDDFIPKPSVSGVYTDKATVSGMVAKLSKQYASRSGFSL